MSDYLLKNGRIPSCTDLLLEKLCKIVQILITVIIYLNIWSLYILFDVVEDFSQLFVQYLAK